MPHAWLTAPGSVPCEVLQGCSISHLRHRGAKGGCPSTPFITHTYVAPAGSCFLPPGVAERATGPQTAAFSAQPLAPPEDFLPTFQARADSSLLGTDRTGHSRKVPRPGGWNPRPQGGEGAQQSPGAADSRPSPSIVSRAWRQWSPGAPGRQACTLQPVSQPHNAQGAGGAGSQGPLMPVPSGSPCQASESWQKKLDSVLGHSRALFLSQGGMRDSPRSEWGPLARWRRNRAVTVPKRAPHTAPGSDRPSWQGLAQASDKEKPGQGWIRRGMAQHRLAVTLQDLGQTHGSQMRLTGWGPEETQPPRHSSPNPKEGAQIPRQPTHGTSPC